jgi:hypothetical protein
MRRRKDYRWLLTSETRDRDGLHLRRVCQMRATASRSGQSAPGWDAPPPRSQG